MAEISTQLWHQTIPKGLEVLKKNDLQLEILILILILSSNFGFSSSG